MTFTGAILHLNLALSAIDLSKKDINCTVYIVLTSVTVLGFDMVCCVAVGCSNRPGMGKIMHRFPRDPQRRKEWEVKVHRKDWKSNNNSYLCADHFDETQYEDGRADNLKKLKPYALPTLFTYSKTKSRKPPRKRCIDEVPVKDDPSKRLCIEHSYVKSDYTTHSQPQNSSNGDECKIEVDPLAYVKSDYATPTQPQNSSSGGECDIKVDPLGKVETRPDEDSIPLHGARKGLLFLDSTTTVGNSSQDARILTMQKTIKHLKETLYKERREKRNLAKQKKTQEMLFAKVFNRDQLDRLSRKSTRGVKWSNETIKKALQLRFTCGARGYALLLSQKQPLPSMRSLRRILEADATVPKEGNVAPGDDIAPDGDVASDDGDDPDDVVPPDDDVAPDGDIDPDGDVAPYDDPPDGEVAPDDS